MNIASLKALMTGLRDDIEEVQFDELCSEVERIKEAKRQADVEELRLTLAKAAELEAKLGIKKAQEPLVKPGRKEPEHDLTDADMGFAGEEDDDTSASSFRAELIALRDYNVSKRRRMHEH